MKNTDLNIENRASCLLGRQLEAHDEQLLRQLCADAQAQLKMRLRRGVNAEDIIEVFESACALYAAAMLLELKGGGVSGFTAGRVSVQLGGKAPETLRRQATDMLAAYTDAGGFEFVGVS